MIELAAEVGQDSCLARAQLSGPSGRAWRAQHTTLAAFSSCFPTIHYIRLPFTLPSPHWLALPHTRSHRHLRLSSSTICEFEQSCDKYLPTSPRADSWPSSPSVCCPCSALRRGSLARLAIISISATQLRQLRQIRPSLLRPDCPLHRGSKELRQGIEL